MLSRTASRRYPAEVQLDIDAVSAEIRRLQETLAEFQREHAEVSASAHLFIAEVEVDLDSGRVTSRSCSRPSVVDGKLRFQTWNRGDHDPSWEEIPAQPTGSRVVEVVRGNTVLHLTVSADLDVAEAFARTFQP